MPIISQKAKIVKIMKVQTESFASGVSRTLATHKIVFFMTSVNA